MNLFVNMIMKMNMNAIFVKGIRVLIVINDEAFASRIT